MSNVSRRDFLKTTMVGTGAVAATSSWLSAAPATGSFSGTDMVSLGQTGIQVSRLAQGTGFKGSNQSSAHTRQGKAAFERLLKHGLDRGIRFIDMADLYGSHTFVGEVVKGLPREKYALLSKIWPREAEWNTPPGSAKKKVERFRKELDVDQLEVCLIHCMTDAQWPDKYERIRDELSELQDKNVVRAKGVSCHDLGALNVAADHPWVDVIFARINHKGGKKYKCDATLEEVTPVLKRARANGKAIVGMKIFGEGTLVKPEEKDASLRYVFTNKLVDAVTIGMLNPKEVDDTLKRMRSI
ncbi:MAG: aldo/keto reductase [Pirellulaceae bacterium]